MQPTAFQPQFQIPVRDLERSDLRRRWDVSPEWLDWALSESDAKSSGTSGVLEVYVKKSGPEVLVKGEVHARVTMACARTLEPVEVSLDTEIYLLLVPRSSTRTGAARTSKRRGATKTAVPKGAAATETTKDAPAAATATKPRPVRSREARNAESEAAEEQLSAELAARDEYEGDNMVLDAFVREHLLLEQPLFPVKSDLPFDQAPATDTPPDESGATLDPRLAPLAALASQLQRRGKIEKSD